MLFIASRAFREFRVICLDSRRLKRFTLSVTSWTTLRSFAEKTREPKPVAMSTVYIKKKEKNEKKKREKKKKKRKKEGKGKKKRKMSFELVFGKLQKFP